MIQELLDEHINKNQEAKKDRVRSGCYSPSLFGACYRRQVWNREDKEVTNPPDDRALRVFECGNIFHDFVQRLLPDHQCEVEVKEPDISGRADIVTEEEVIELKSHHSRAFWYSSKEGYDIKKEKKNNIMQVCYYALQLKKERARLVYISKDDLCINEWTFTPTQWEDAINEELRKLRHWWEVRKTPPAEPRLYKGKECQYCAFKDTCNEKEKENG
jgi:hypothetical protein